MENFYFIGVDVSKKKLDLCVMLQGKTICEEIVNNHPKAIMELLEVLKRDLGFENSTGAIKSHVY